MISRVQDVGRPKNKLKCQLISTNPGRLVLEEPPILCKTCTAREKPGMEQTSEFLTAGIDQKYSRNTVSAIQAGRDLFSTSMLTSFTTSRLFFIGVTATSLILARILDPDFTG